MAAYSEDPFRYPGRNGQESMQTALWYETGASSAMLLLLVRMVGGLLLLAVGVMLGLALFSYSPDDPSPLHATARAAENWLGYTGAYVADLLLQSVGRASWLLVIIALVWAGRLLHRPVEPMRGVLALPSTIAAILFGSACFAAHMPPENWPLPHGLGGLIGDRLLASLLSMVDGPVGLLVALFGFMLGIVTLGLLAWACGVDRREAQLGLAFLRDGFTELMRLTRNLSQKLRSRSDAWQRMTGLLGGLRVSVMQRRGFEYDTTGGMTGRAEPDFGTPPLPQPAEVVPPAPRRQRLSRAAQAEIQPPLPIEPKPRAYDAPPLAILAPAESRPAERQSHSALQENARMLESVLNDFGVQGHIHNIRPGPVVTLYELEPAPGIKASRVIGLAEDIARSMSALSARIATVPGRNVIGIELPNQRREKVMLSELFSHPRFGDASFPLALALGKDIAGEPVVADLARMPHLLIAGTTGSGKSVAINTMILSLLYRLSPQQCRLIMIDPKMLELSVYDGIPHLLAPVVTDPKKAVGALKWVVREMEERYAKMSKLGVRNLDGYNQRVADALAKGEDFRRLVQTGFDDRTGQPIYEETTTRPEPLPMIVVIVDEMADLMMVAGKEIEACIQRLAQMARASGIHLVMATQRPSVDVITGTIKANFPTRISFQVTSKIDSRTVLGEQGAEQLLGQGDMLYMSGGGRIIRVHGPFVSDQEVEKVVAHLRTLGEPEYLAEITATEEEAPIMDDMLGSDNGDDDLYARAVEIVTRERKASTSYIQRRLQIGYVRAARLVDLMEERGVVGPANHVGKREIYVGTE